MNSDNGLAAVPAGASKGDRVAVRPDPASWSDDELMNLSEAARLFWPDGPLTLASLRTAVRDGRLAVSEIAGKFLTSKRAIMEMSVCRTRLGSTPRPRESDFVTKRLRDLHG
jgi:hypothetical protein